MYNTLYISKQRDVCVRSHAEKNIRVGQFEIMFLNIFFTTELMLNGIYNAFLHLMRYI